MKPLKSPLSASEENVHVKIQGKVYRCANLLKSGILNQTTILVGHDDIWNEVNIIGLGKSDTFNGLENSNLHNFKTVVEKQNVWPKFFDTLESNKTDQSYELTHEDRMKLDVKYGFSNIHIEKLEKHLKRFGHKTGNYSITEVLKYLKKQGRTIQEYINAEELQAKEIINNSNKLIKMEETQTIQSERIAYLESMGFAWAEASNAYVARYGTVEAPARFEVSLRGIEEDDEEKWQALVERIEFSLPSVARQEITEIANEAKQIIENKTAPADKALPAVPVKTESTAKKPVSLSVIGNLSADRILEFQAMKENQEGIVKANPFIKITDKASYEKAKKAKSVLLKASTAIDGKEGHKANKTKFLKQLSERLDVFLDGIAKLSRAAYDKQDLEIKRWESEEALRIQNEKKAEMEKVQKRTDSLFAVPMVFNGTHYQIGTLYIMPSQITSATDEEFAALVLQAQGIKASLDATAAAEKSKDDEIAALRAQLAKLTGQTVPPLVPEETATIKQAQPGPTQSPATNTVASVQTSTVQQKTIDTAPAQTAQPVAGELVYTQPSNNNKLLLAFDLENLKHVQEGKQAFLKCRSYYIKGLVDAGVEIESIFANPAIEKKAGPLKELGTILKNS